MATKDTGNRHDIAATAATILAEQLDLLAATGATPPTGLAALDLADAALSEAVSRRSGLLAS